MVLFADDSVSVYSAGLQTNSDLFVWNGREVRKGIVQQIRPHAKKAPALDLYSRIKLLERFNSMIDLYVLPKEN